VGEPKRLRSEIPYCVQEGFLGSTWDKSDERIDEIESAEVDKLHNDNKKIVVRHIPLLMKVKILQVRKG
jgi:uncharacterized protein with NRDE domain